MPTPILMPKLSDDMREGKILAWKKKEGDTVESGEAIAEVETDKANLEVEAYNAGKLVKIIAPVGTTVACGQPIALVAEEGEEPAAEPTVSAKPATAPAKPAASPAPGAPAPVLDAVAPAKQGGAVAEEEKGAAVEAGRVRASPLARRMASDGHLDLRGIEGSGPGGRVVKADVERAMSGPPAAPASAPSVRAQPGTPAPAPAQTLVQQRAPSREAPPPAEKKPAARLPPPPLREEKVPLSGMRKAIARRMAEAKPGAPHFYLSIDVDMTSALELRKRINEELSADWGTTISVNDLVLKAAALSLLRRPEVNATYAGESVLRHGAVHLGFALAVEDGLLTPVIRDAQQKNLGQIAREARELAERGRARKLKPDEYQGGTFTVSNLGMFGVREFSAIINPGEAAILAVGVVDKRAVVGKDDQLRVASVVTATLSGDHRVIDGALGAQLLQEFKAILEQPLRLLA